MRASLCCTLILPKTRNKYHSKNLLVFRCIGSYITTNPMMHKQCKPYWLFCVMNRFCIDCLMYILTHCLFQDSLKTCIYWNIIMYEKSPMALPWMTWFGTLILQEYFSQKKSLKSKIISTYNKFICVYIHTPSIKLVEKLWHFWSLY